MDGLESSNNGEKPLPSLDGAEHPAEPKPTPSQDDAAQTIQRNYRGYRARRELDGLGLSPTARWLDAVKEAQYRNMITPRERKESKEAASSNSFAQREWKHAKAIAKRAHSDDTSETDGEAGMTEEQLAAYRRQKSDEKRRREQTSKMMGLEYFLEMVDTKHRYGSHLRAYHAVWKQADTNENFFYWLDEGAGKDVEVESCSRERLERDQVRYLSREERQKYLVKIDKSGRLYYAKNGNYVTTSADFRDSLEGIVPKDDPTPSFREEDHHHHHHGHSSEHTTALSSDDEASDSEDDGVSSSDSTHKEEGQHYVNKELNEAKGVKKVQYISAAALLNHLLQKTTKKNTWIFVADTSFRLYIGIKQSGAFQHSSFLHGARISAAGLIKCKDGQLRSLSPLSGHYRPPTRNFRAFVASLRKEGVDMSRVSISKSYAVLLGLEGYMGAKKKVKEGKEGVKDGVERVFRPEESKKKREGRLDNSRSAQREREVEEQRRLEREKLRRETSWSGRLSRRFRSSEQVEQVDKADAHGV